RISPCEAERVVLTVRGTDRVISITGAISPVIDCFTILGGDAAGLGGDPGGTVENDAGGGIYSRDAAPIIIHNVITANYGCDTCPTAYGRGGGIYLLDAPASAVISGNLIARNVADNSTWGRGGGLMLRDSDAQVLSNTFDSNRAGLGAGEGGGIVVVGGHPTIAGNTFTQNQGASSGVRGLGGGLYVESSGVVTIERNTFNNNRAINGETDASMSSLGGGLAVNGQPTIIALIRDNRFFTNVAALLGGGRGRGGGMYLSDLVSPSLVVGNELDGNIGGHNGSGDGGGMFVLSSTVVISDNVLSDNTATWSGEDGYGGGMYARESSVLVAHNVISGNRGAMFYGGPVYPEGYGGGIVLGDSQATLVHNQIVGNVGTNDTLGAGGGVWGHGGQVRIEDNTIAGNAASMGADGYGGGLYLVSSPGAIVAGNQVVSNTAGSQGGGLLVAKCEDAVVSDNWLQGNVGSEAGGGVYVYNSDGLSLARNTVYRNSAALGGAMYLSAQDAAAWANRLTNNVVVENEGLGAAAPGTPGIYVQRLLVELIHTTVARNLSGNGVGVYVGTGATAYMTNTILVSQTVGLYGVAGTTMRLVGTLWGAGAWANGMNTGGPGAISIIGPSLAEEPGFLDPDGGDYHLAEGSAAIDAGVAATVADDIDGDLRPMGPAPDLGADEAPLRTRLPLVMRDS
ncbi:MAG: hypothetical protein GX601_09045, partial [Anaerolineales bacterium]|nr:hypothetical protein [Anaerolineales bacterium]